MRGKLALLLVFVFLFLSAAACGDAADTQREESIKYRTDLFAKAEAMYPAPKNVNFPVRGLLVEYTKRQDLINHPWFNYIMSDNGRIVMYFVSTTLPVNSCAFLSSTEDIDANNDVVLTAPSTDGIYYGGSGASSACNGWIFKDAATGAIGLVFGTKMLSFDAPLVLETEPELIQIENK